MEKNFRVAVIGYGVGGAVFHAPLVNAVPGLELVAIVSNNPERVAQARGEFPNIKILASAEAVFAKPLQYDLVVITSPNRFHFPQAKAALLAGLHVVIDKPMAVQAKECKELIDLAKQQNKLLSVFHNRRWDGDFLTVQKILQEEMLGTVVRFESRFERYRPQPKTGAWRELGTKEDGGGLLFDLGSHLIDQACALFGSPSSVYCELDKRRADVETDDDCFIALSFASGVRAHLWASVLCRIKGPRYRVSGHQGSFEKYGMDPQEDALRAGLRPSAQIDGQNLNWGEDTKSNWGNVFTQMNGLAVHGQVETLPGDYCSYYQKILAALRGFPFVAAPVVAEDAYQTALIIEAAYKSAAEKLVIDL